MQADVYCGNVSATTRISRKHNRRLDIGASVGSKRELLALAIPLITALQSRDSRICAVRAGLSLRE
jgi:hypothetical protein